MNLKSLSIAVFSAIVFAIPSVSQACPGVAAGAPCACTAGVGVAPVTANVFMVPAAVGGGMMTYSRFVSAAPVVSAVAPVSAISSYAATAVAPVSAYSSAGLGVAPVGVGMIGPVGAGAYGVGTGFAPVGAVGRGGLLGGLGGRTKIKSKAKSKIRIR